MYYLGIDIGGTSVKAGIVNPEGKLIHHYELPTLPEQGFEDFLQRLHDTFLTECEEHRVDVRQVIGIGVGVPGFLDVEHGTVVEAVNLGWKDLPLVSRLQEAFGMPVAIENDANVAALGEAWAGAGAGRKHLLCVTVGTGVGGGIVLNGLLHRGANGMAGEVGHMKVQRHDGILCNCGLHGCLETVCSATAIIRNAKQRLEPALAEAVSGAADVFQFAQAGNETALAVVQEAADWLGYGLALMAITLNPDGIVIGGGVSKAKELFLDPVRNAFESYSLPRVSEAAHVMAAALGNTAGIVGAARLIQQQTTR